MEPVRPSPAQRADTLLAWEQYKSKNIDENVLNPKMVVHRQELFVAGDFLESRLRTLGLPDATVENYCFSLGRMCVGNPDVWANFDRILTHATKEAEKWEARQTWSTTPVLQEPPPPTDMLKNWRQMARQSVGPEGVYPMPFVWYVNGQFYTGVVDYQREGSCTKPAFGQIRWDNNYWNHALREFPIEDMRKALPPLGNG